MMVHLVSTLDASSVSAFLLSSSVLHFLYSSIVSSSTAKSVSSPLAVERLSTMSQTSSCPNRYDIATFASCPSSKPSS